jgi:hypothetical protein
MGFGIAWGVAFEAKLRTVHWRHAARLCEAVIRYAETGKERRASVSSATSGGST